MSSAASLPRLARRADALPVEVNLLMDVVDVCASFAFEFRLLVLAVLAPVFAGAVFALDLGWRGILLLRLRAPHRPQLGLGQVARGRSLHGRGEAIHNEDAAGLAISSRPGPPGASGDRAGLHQRLRPLWGLAWPPCGSIGRYAPGRKGGSMSQGSLSVLIIPSLQMPEVSAAMLAQVRRAAGDDARITVAESTGEALEAIQDAEVLLGRIDSRLLAAAPRLRWVHATTAGADAYLFPEMLDSPVLLSGDKGLVGSHLAETAFGLLLAITRRIAVAILDGPASWERRVDYRREEVELEGLTMGIVGFGGTGRALARRAAAFGMRCIATDHLPVPASDAVPEVWPAERLDELLAQSDVVASGLPLTPATHRLFDERAFAQMKPGAFFVNVTRGEVVDSDALVRAVASGRLGGAGLDVTHEEPLPADHALWRTPNIVMTPHTAGASQLRLQRNLDRFCRNIVHYRASEPLEGLIDKEAGY